MPQIRSLLRQLTLGTSLFLITSACANSPSTKSTRPGTLGTGVCPNHYGRFEGKATIYADKFEGRRTACGIRFRQNEMTAAIKTTVRSRIFGRSAIFCDNLYALVTNKRTGEQFSIPVIDTGGMPVAVIDLSEQAAREMRLTSLDEVEFDLCRD